MKTKEEICATCRHEKWEHSLVDINQFKGVKEGNLKCVHIDCDSELYCPCKKFLAKNQTSEPSVSDSLRSQNHSQETTSAGARGVSPDLDAVSSLGSSPDTLRGSKNIQYVAGFKDGWDVSIAEVEKSFDNLIKMFESVNEYSDAQYWVMQEKKRLFSNG